MSICVVNAESCCVACLEERERMRVVDVGSCCVACLETRERGRASRMLLFRGSNRIEREE